MPICPACPICPVCLRYFTSLSNFTPWVRAHLWAFRQSWHCTSIYVLDNDFFSTLCCSNMLCGNVNRLWGLCQRSDTLHMYDNCSLPTDRTNAVCSIQILLSVRTRLHRLWDCRLGFYSRGRQFRRGHTYGASAWGLSSTKGWTHHQVSSCQSTIRLWVSGKHESRTVRRIFVASWSWCVLGLVYPTKASLKAFDWELVSNSVLARSLHWDPCCEVTWQGHADPALESGCWP